MPFSLGAIGGKPRSSLYLYGIQEDCAFYLDPHTVQESVSLDTDFSQDNKASQTYRCTQIQSIKLSALDPTMTFGFYCKDREELNEFWKNAKELSRSSHSVFQVGEKTPSLDLDSDLFESGEEHNGDEGENGEWSLL